MRITKFEDDSKWYLFMGICPVCNEYVTLKTFNSIGIKQTQEEVTKMVKRVKKCKHNGVLTNEIIIS